MNLCYDLHVGNGYRTTMKGHNDMTYNANYFSGESKYSKGVAAVLCVLGLFLVAGLHRIYVGKIGTGLLWLFTGGLFLVGTIVDLIMIASGEFKDKSGYKLLS